MPPQPPLSPLLTPQDAAAYLRVAVRTLSNWRSQGGGPPYLKIRGLIRYRQDELEAWVQAQHRAHTNDPGPPVAPASPARTPRRHFG
jgi:hypothetical protein